MSFPLGRRWTLQRGHRRKDTPPYCEQDQIRDGYTHLLLREGQRRDIVKTIRTRVFIFAVIKCRQSIKSRPINRVIAEMLWSFHSTRLLVIGPSFDDTTVAWGHYRVSTFAQALA